MGKRESIRYNLLTSTLFSQLQSSIKGCGAANSHSINSNSNSSSTSTSTSSSKNSSKCNSANTSTENMMSCIKQQAMLQNEQTSDCFYLGNQSPDDHSTADSLHNKQVTVAFFKVFTNQSLVAEINKHILSPRSIFSDAISYRPFHFYRYDQIISAEWIIANGYIGLLVDKLQANRTLVFNQRSIPLLAGKCTDPIIFHKIVSLKSDYFYGNFPLMIDTALEHGNIDVLQYFIDELACTLPPNAVEIAVRYGHLTTVQYLLAKRKACKQPLPSSSIPVLFKLALTYRHLSVARFIFDKIGFFLSGPVEDLFRLLCCLGDFEFFKSVYETFQLVFISCSLKEYYLYLSDLLDYTSLPISREHFKIIAYVERGNPKITIPPISDKMNDPALYSLYIRWVHLNREKVVGPMVNSILRTAVQFDDLDLFKFTVRSFKNPHPSLFLQQACTLGSITIVKYLLEQHIETLTYRAIQIAYIGKHNDIIQYIRENIKSYPLDTSYLFCKPLEYTCYYPIEILQASLTNNNQPTSPISTSTTTTTKVPVNHDKEIRDDNNIDNIIYIDEADNNKTTTTTTLSASAPAIFSPPCKIDPILKILSSANILDTDTLQDIFVRAFNNGDSEVLKYFIDHRLEDITINRQVWQMVAKIGDPQLFERVVKLHQQTKEGQTAKLGIKTLATRVAVESCIWGQKKLLEYLITQHNLDMDQQQVEYFITSATFNGNSNIIKHLFASFKVSKKVLATLMRHAINYKHFDLIRLYHQEYSVPLDKKLLKNINFSVETFKKKNRFNII